MSQCTVPGDARTFFASAEFGEQDAKAEPQGLGIPRAGAVDQAAGENRRAAHACFAGQGLRPAKAKPDRETCWSWELLLTLPPPFLPHHATTSDSPSIHRKTM